MFFGMRASPPRWVKPGVLSIQRRHAACAETRYHARLFFEEARMKVEKDAVVSFHYHLSDETGAEVENSRDREPMAIMFGHNNIIAGLEQAMVGHEAGDRFDVVVPPDQAYGERREDAAQRVPKKYFRDADHLQPGMTTVLNTKDGRQQMVTVTKVGSSVIDVDTNHPMAGKTLRFDIEITDVRAATEEELAHGHVHGPGGHAH
jgi:FKBP-type peptidyl-prolyl cis-trans isomerase SlyD